MRGINLGHIATWTCLVMLLTNTALIAVHAAPPSIDFENLPDRTFYFEDTPVSSTSGNQQGETYMGSPGYRLIPGDTCKQDVGVSLDEPIEKDCSKAQPPEGNVTHQPFEFPQEVVGHWFFRESKTIIVHLRDGEVWQSGNEGYSWAIPKAVEKEKVLAVYHHQYSNDRAYLITKEKVFITTDTGRSYTGVDLPAEPNMMGLQLIHTHPLESDWLIYTGAQDCAAAGNCKAVAYYSTTHGRSWTKIDEYVRSCSWARDKDLKIDSRLIMCESYRDKKGSQLFVGGNNPLELWVGGNFYKDRKKIFNNVVGHTKFSEYLLVGEVTKDSLELQVSLDGRNYHKGMFPPSMNLNNHAYTVLESSTDSVFLHLTTSSQPGAEMGNLLKSNSNGIYYSLSLENVNRNNYGYVDFEKMIGLDGIALVNIVANPSGATVSRKKLQTRITHNNGGSWKPMTPPAVDSDGQKYKCEGVKCALHIHGYTERIDARATYSSPSVIGVMVAVGNVGEYLAPYAESDTFLTRDGGFTWEEIHKDAHVYGFGDSGSVLVIANDEKPTDRVLYSTDEGLHWKEYNIGMDVRVRSIVTMTAETSRKFILFGHQSNGRSVAVHLDLSAITNRICNLDVLYHDDIELWSPSEERDERCFFGQQTIYHRRIRESDCVVGDQFRNYKKTVKNCECKMSDFECEFNHVRNSDGNCILIDGASALTSDTSETCITEPDSDYWYERTAYRKIPYSTCEAGTRPDCGAAHSCDGVQGHSTLFWPSILILPFGFTALVGYYYIKKGYRRGHIRLPDNANSESDKEFQDGDVVDTIASVP